MLTSINNEDTLLTIEPVDELSRTSLDIPANDAFLASTHDSSNDAESSSSREQTPATDSAERCLVIHLHSFPKSPLDGWVCGSDVERCDILLDRSHDNGVSGVAFSIDIDRQTRQIALIAGKRGLRYKATSSHRRLLLNKDEHLPLNGGHTYTVFVGLLRFEIRPIVRNEAEERAFALKFHEFLAHVWPVFVALSAGDDVKVGSDGQEDGEGKTSDTRILSGVSGRRYRVIEHVLGNGASATVKRACGENDGRLYAVKFFNPINRGAGELSTKRRGFKREIQLLRLLRHDKIVKYVDTDADRTILVMEAMEGQSLMEQFHLQRFSNHELEIILHDMLEALQEVHSNGLIHFDIKPENILVERRDRRKIIVKLADFGLMSSRGDALGPAGTYPYCAPELFERYGPYDCAADLWSLGLVMMRLIWDLPNPLPQKDVGFDPLSVWAYGWRGTIHRAFRRLIELMDLDNLVDLTGYFEHFGDEHIEVGNPTTPVLPAWPFVLAVITMLQPLPSSRGTAHEHLCNLRKAHGVGHFKSLRNESQPGDDFSSFWSGSASPPYEVIPRSPFITGIEDLPVDLDEYFEIEARKTSNHILVTRDRMHVDLESLLNASDISNDRKDEMRRSVGLDEQTGYISFDDAFKVCNRLKLREVKSLLQDENYFITRPGSLVMPNIDTPDLDEIPLTEPIPIACLRYLGLVCLDGLLTFAGVQEDDLQRELYKFQRRLRTIPCISPDATLVCIEDAISIAGEFGELCLLLRELLIFEHFLARQPGQSHSALFDVLRGLDVVIVALDRRVVLLRKDSGEIERHSLEKASCGRRLEKEDFDGLIEWITFEDASAMGMIAEEDRLTIESAVTLVKIVDP